MQKRLEQSEVTSCWNKAEDYELVFVLLERDRAFPKAVREWAKERVRLGLDALDSPKIKSALADAEFVEQLYAL